MAVHTSRPVFERLEVVESGRRRRWTEEEKLQIVAESLSGSRQVSSTVQPQPGGEAGSFVPAAVLSEGAANAPPALSSTRMEIVVSRGRRIIVDAGVDVSALARVLDLLERR